MDLQIEEKTCPPGLQLPRHTHDRAMLAVAVQGSFETEVSGRTHGCGRGGVFTRAGEPHGNRFGASGARIILLQFDDPLPIATRVGDPHLNALARRVAFELRAPDAAAPLAIEGLALELLARAARAREDARDACCVRAAQAFLEAHLLAPLRVREIAAAAGVHPAHLARAFRAARGETLASYLRRRRVEWAAAQVVGSQRALASIALEAGFCDQGHFTRVFRRRFRTTPRAMRTAARSR
jgi:AraC family transcriptional regulator